VCWSNPDHSKAPTRPDGHQALSTKIREHRYKEKNVISEAIAAFKNKDFEKSYAIAMSNQ